MSASPPIPAPLSPSPLAERGNSYAGDAWLTARGAISLARPVVVGILNVTPDSFSDGGQFLDPQAALKHAAALIEEGADLLDVGAESTRPGRPEPVFASEEWRRLEPVLTGLVKRFPSVPVSVDTVKSDVARRALDAGAWIINDVSGLRLDPEIAAVCAAQGAGLVLMHSRGTVSDMATYDHASYDDVMANVTREMAEAVRVAEGRGVARNRIVVDPGLGFAKRPEHNVEVLRRLDTIGALGLPIMVGPSRKRFLGQITGRDIGDRDSATAAACVAAWFGGARLFRVHAVRVVRDALQVAHAVRPA